MPEDAAICSSGSLVAYSASRTTLGVHMFLHVPSLELVKPGLQVQSDKASLPGGEEDPATMPLCQLAVFISN